MNDLTFSNGPVCTFTPPAQRAEVRRIKADLAPLVVAQTRLDDGARLTFAAAPGMRQKVDLLLALDTGACADFDTQVENDARMVTLTLRSQGKGVALAQNYLNDTASATSVKTAQRHWKWVAVAGACGLACSAPILLGAMGLGAAGIGLGAMGIELGVLGVVAITTLAYVMYKRRHRRSKKGAENADRCGC